MKVQCYCSVINVFSRFFRVKHIVRRVVESQKSGMSCFSCRSLLLRWLRTVHVWLLVRFTVLPLIYSCAGNTCGKLVNGHERGVVN